MAKKIEGYIKLQVPAGSATPSPPIGPALGQRGVNIMEFCKAFNASTQEMDKGMPIPTVITVYADRSFTFITKTPPASYFLKKAAKLAGGSKEPGKIVAGKVTRARSRKSPRPRWPISTPMISTWRCASSKALPVRWALKWWRADPMVKISKQAKEMANLDREKLYSVEEALTTLRQFKRKFDETVEVAMNLGVDPRHADQMVRGMVSLPSGTGKDVRVAVFARGDNAEKALAAGATRSARKT